MSSPPNPVPDDGPLLLVASAMDRPAEFRLPGGSAVVFTRPNPARDAANQDAAALIPAGGDRHVLVVADGMGGARQGGEAAAAAVRCLAEEFPRRDPDHAIRASVLDGIEAANRHLRRHLPASGTTLAAVEVCGHSVRPYHVGDSSIFVVGQRGKPKFQSISHSPVGFAVEAGLLDEGEALHHDELHLVSNVVGSPAMRIELGAPLELARFDTLLIASDGLTDNLHPGEIIERIRKGPLAVGVARLAELATSRMATVTAGLPGKPDDLTLIAYRRTS